MRASTKRTLSLLISVLFIIAALVVYVNLVRPEYRDIQELRGALAGKTSLLASQKTIISQVRNLLAQFKGAVQLQETVSLALPANEAAAAIFQQLQAIAKSSGLTIQAFGLNLLSLKSDKLGTVQVTLKIFGNYAGIQSFLKSTETNVRVMDLVSFKIEQGGKSNQDIYAYTVVLNTYYQK